MRVQVFLWDFFSSGKFPIKLPLYSEIFTTTLCKDSWQNQCSLNSYRTSTYLECCHGFQSGNTQVRAVFPARFSVCWSDINISPTVMLLFPACSAYYLMHLTIASSEVFLVKWKQILDSFLLYFCCLLTQGDLGHPWALQQLKFILGAVCLGTCGRGYLFQRAIQQWWRHQQNMVSAQWVCYQITALSFLYMVAPADIQSACK